MNPQQAKKAVEKAFASWSEAREVEAQALADRGEAQRAKAQHASLERQGRFVAAELAWVKSQDATREAAAALDNALHVAGMVGGSDDAALVDLPRLADEVGRLVDAAVELRRQATEAEQKAIVRLADARAARERIALTRQADGLPAPALIPSPSSGVLSPGHVLLAIREALSSPVVGPKNPEKIRTLENELRTIAHSIALREQEKAREEREAAELRAAREQDHQRRTAASAREAETAKRAASREAAERAELEAAGLARIQGAA